MKYLLSLLIVFFTTLAPALADPVKLTNLVNIFETEEKQVVLNEKGYTREVSTTIKHYEYMTDEGRRLELPYKVKGVPDLRPFKARHPVIYGVIPLVPGIVWNLVQMAL